MQPKNGHLRAFSRYLSTHSLWFQPCSVDHFSAIRKVSDLKKEENKSFVKNASPGDKAHRTGERLVQKGKVTQTRGKVQEGERVKRPGSREKEK